MKASPVSSFWAGRVPCQGESVSSVQLSVEATLHSRHAKQLNHFHMRCFRTLFRIRWQDKIPDTEVPGWAGNPSIDTLQVRWPATSSECLTADYQNSYYMENCVRQALSWDFKDCLKESLKDLDINLSSWESLALDPSNWRNKLTTGARAVETRHTAEADRKRAARKARATSTFTAAPTHMCPTCGRAFRARIGLISHLRTHKTDEIQGFTDSHDVKRFYDALKAVYGPSPLASPTSSVQMGRRSCRFWRYGLNTSTRSSTALPRSETRPLLCLPQMEINLDLDNIPTEEDIRKAIKELSCGKAPGSDAFPAEV
ncbi:hypothetical protein ACOMHN_010355 [Nucella lapillus]